MHVPSPSFTKMCLLGIVFCLPIQGWAACKIQLNYCKNYLTMPKLPFYDSYDGSESNEARCWKRSSDYLSWCGNTPAQSVQSVYELGGKAISLAVASNTLTVQRFEGTLHLFPVYGQFPSVTNSLFQLLPQNWNALMQRFTVGGAGVVTPGAVYGGVEKASNSALYIVPPQAAGDFTKVMFSVDLNPAFTWYFNFKVGMLNALTSGGSVKIAVVVSALNEAIGEEKWKVVLERTLSAYSSDQISVPLGVWSMRKQFNIAIQVQKVSNTAEQPMIVFDGLNLASGIKRPELGIVRSNLTWEDTSTREADIGGSAGLGAKWFRDGFFLPNNGTSDFVDVVRRVKSKGMKMLALVMQSPVDYDAGWNAYILGGPEFKARCGWDSGALPLSTINHTKFAARLWEQLAAIKNAGLTIDAFEIGNEFDWVCFNADVSWGSSENEQVQDSAARAYAKFLETAVTVIRHPNLFPKATIVTFGTANIPAEYAPGLHFNNAPAFVNRLRNIDGKNYLNLVDAYGIHLYPNMLNGNYLELRNGQLDLTKSVQYLGSDKPHWITEWGYSVEHSAFSNAELRAKAILEFLDMTSNQYNLKLGPHFFYAYSSPSELTEDKLRQRFGLIDMSGRLLPEAQVLRERYRPHAWQ